MPFSFTPSPVAFTLFGLPVHWYGLFALASFLIAWFFAPRFARLYGLERRVVEDAMLYGLLGGILGARLLHVLLLWEYYAQHPLLVIAVWQGGLAAFGGILGGLLGVWLVARRERVSFWRLADVLAPWLFLAFSLGRIANLLNGEILGRPCSCAWALVLPDGVPRHPVQLYGMVKDLIVFLLGLFLVKRKPGEGIVFLMVMLAYAILRFLVEFYRAEPTVFLGLDLAQWFLLMIMPFLAWLLFKQRNASRG